MFRMHVAPSVIWSICGPGCFLAEYELFEDMDYISFLNLECLVHSRLSTNVCCIGLSDSIVELMLYYQDSCAQCIL